MDAAASGDADLAAVGALVADPGRCRILLALDDGRALPASMLAAEAGVTRATASSHLRKLTTARTCYDHLAGRLGVALMAAFLDRGWMTGGDGTFHADTADHDQLAAPGHDLDYALTPSGRDFLDDFGVDLPPRRRTVRYCVDWTEQRHHLAGGLGCGLLGRVTDLGWIRPTRGNRAVEITAAGRDGLSDTFGIDPD